MPRARFNKHLLLRCWCPARSALDAAQRRAEPGAGRRHRVLRKTLLPAAPGSPAQAPAPAKTSEQAAGVSLVRALKKQRAARTRGAFPRLPPKREAAPASLHRGCRSPAPGRLSAASAVARAPGASAREAAGLARRADLRAPGPARPRRGASLAAKPDCGASPSSPPASGGAGPRRGGSAALSPGAPADRPAQPGRLEAGRRERRSLTEPLRRSGRRRIRRKSRSRVLAEPCAAALRDRETRGSPGIRAAALRGCEGRLLLPREAAKPHGTAPDPGRCGERTPARPRAPRGFRSAGRRPRGLSRGVPEHTRRRGNGGGAQPARAREDESAPEAAAREPRGPQGPPTRVFRCGFVLLPQVTRGPPSEDRRTARSGEVKKAASATADA